MNGMTCEHKRLKCVNCVLYCADCGAKVERGTTSSAPEGAPSPKGEGKETTGKRKTAKKGATGK